PSPVAEPTPQGAAEWGPGGAAAPEPETPPPPAQRAEAPAPPVESPEAGPSPRAARGRAPDPAVLNGGRTFVLRLDKPALRVSNYGLREPPGIVIDVLGAGPEGGETRIETGSNAVRLVKASPRGDGTRFIIYLRSRTMPRYTVTPNGTELQITIAN
ncbi:MAG: AMIN domain-containing protein, partial [Deltaproteobacteria bacterium]|nr:AMIN domain-containing protein [Deltaproteobacteria bacterium]